jgi:hypothetical protein
MAGVLSNLDTRITKWAEASNPFFSSAPWNEFTKLGCSHADVLALIPFAALSALLYLVGRELLLANKAKA